MGFAHQPNKVDLAKSRESAAVKAAYDLRSKLEMQDFVEKGMRKKDWSTKIRDPPSRESSSWPQPITATDLAPEVDAEVQDLELKSLQQSHVSEEDEIQNREATRPSSEPEKNRIKETALAVSVESKNKASHLPPRKVRIPSLVNVGKPLNFSGLTTNIDKEGGLQTVRGAK